MRQERIPSSAQQLSAAPRINTQTTTDRIVDEVATMEGYAVGAHQRPVGDST